MFYFFHFRYRMIAMDQNLKLYSDGNTMLEIAKKTPNRSEIANIFGKKRVRIFADTRLSDHISFNT